MSEYHELATFVGDTVVLHGLRKGTEARLNGKLAVVLAIETAARSGHVGHRLIVRAGSTMLHVHAGHVLQSEPTPSARLYFGSHHLNGFYDRVENGFYDAGWLGDAPELPSMRELVGRPVVPGGREIIVVDARLDAGLRHHLDQGRQLLRSVTADRDRVLALGHYVSSAFGGAAPRRELHAQTAAQLDTKMGERGCGVVLLGELTCGICRHRALLFKIMCDAVAVECELVRGLYGERNTGHAWNVVRIKGKPCIVDVMYRPAEIFAAQDDVGRYHPLSPRGSVRSSGGHAEQVRVLASAPRTVAEQTGSQSSWVKAPALGRWLAPHSCHRLTPQLAGS